ncbi:MAG: hypothetical protein AAF714_03595 [Pseudomonadota bacterium]
MSLYSFAGPEQLEVAERAGLLFAELFSDSVGAAHYRSAGLLRVHPNDTVLTPFIAKNPWLGGPSVGSKVPLKDVPPIMEDISLILRDVPAWLVDAVLWVLPDPEPQVAIGSHIHHGTKQGTRGVGVSWSGGHGFLTAGHVAPVRKSRILDATMSSVVGEVQEFQDPAGSGDTPMRDAAIIEWDASVAAPPFASTAFRDASRGETVTIQRHSGPVSVELIATSPGWKSKVINGTYGKVYVTDTCVTTAGDSGALVEDASGNPVGTVVGAIPGFATVIQMMSYQIKGFPTLPSLTT